MQRACDCIMNPGIKQKAIVAVCEFSERMALYTYANKDCLLQMQRYTSNCSEVLQVVKDILLEKYELCHILGLRPYQRKDAVQLMAVYICAARKQDWSFFEQIIDIVNKTAHKEKLHNIDTATLLALYEQIIQTQDTSIGYRAACANRLNVVTRAFYPVIAICKAHILESENAELILDSAFYFSVGRKIALGQHKADSALCQYLRITVADKILPGTLAELFAADLPNNSKLNVTAEDIGSYHYRNLELSYLVSLCLGGSGLLQDHALQAITFNKRKRIKLTALTMEVCLFLSDFDTLEPLAQKYLDGQQNTCSRRDREKMDNVVKEFTVTLRNIVYLSSCLEMYRKSVLATLDIEFFNPALRQATQWAQQLERTVDRQKAELATQKTTQKELRSQNRTLSTESADVRNKNASLQSKIEQQQAYISQLEASLNQLQQQNAELKQDIADLLPPSDDSSVGPNQGAPDSPAIDYRASIASVFEKHKIVFIGGYETSVMAKFAQRNPAAIVIPLSKIVASEALIENADAILFKTDHLSHSAYFKVKQIAYKKRIPFDYLSSGTNVQNLEKSTAETLSAMGFLD